MNDTLYSDSGTVSDDLVLGCGLCSHFRQTNNDGSGYCQKNVVPEMIGNYSSVRYKKVSLTSETCDKLEISILDEF